MLLGAIKEVKRRFGSATIFNVPDKKAGWVARGWGLDMSYAACITVSVKEARTRYSSSQLEPRCLESQFSLKVITGSYAPPVRQWIWWSSQDWARERDAAAGHTDQSDNSWQWWQSDPWPPSQSKQKRQRQFLSAVYWDWLHCWNLGRTAWHFSHSTLFPWPATCRCSPPADRRVAAGRCTASGRHCGSRWCCW